MKSRSITQEQIKAIADHAEAPSRGEDHSEARQLLQSVLTEDGMNAEIRRLASLPEGLYEAERREAADKLKVRATVLDKLVKAERPKKESLQGTAIQLVAREPAASTVDLSQLLDDIVEAIKSYIILKEEEVIAAALWIVASYAVDAFYIFPRLRVRSPTRQCGKTTLLDVIEALVNKPLVVSNTTGAALVRIISLDRPTLLVDEADTFLTSNEDLRGIVNAGHKKGGCIVRCEGDQNEVRSFPCYAAMVIASIRALPGTIEDRSITIVMRRKTRDEYVKRFRGDRPDEHLAALASRCSRWAADHEIALLNAEPAMPEGLFNRSADNWRPLLSVASLASEEWGRKAREAALYRPFDDSELGVRLLADLKPLFETAEAIHSADIVEALLKIEDGPWNECNRGKPLTKNRLATLLREFQIESSQVKIGQVNLNGYRKSQFEAAFSAYLDHADSRGGGIQNSTSLPTLKNKAKMSAETLPTQSLPLKVETLPSGSRPLRGVGRVPEGRVLDDKKGSKDKAVELVDFQKGGPSAMGDACRHCGGSPDGRKLEQLAWDGGLVSLHQGCLEQWVEAQNDGMDLPDFLDRRNLNRGAA